MQKTLTTMALLILVGCSTPINVEEIEDHNESEPYEVHFAVLGINTNAC